MKYHNRIGFFAVVLALVFCLTACGRTPAGERVHITVIHDDTVVCETYQTVSRGQTAELALTLEEGYGFRGCDYIGEYTVTGYSDTVILRLYDVRYDVRLQVETGPLSEGILYDLNGGSFVDPREEGQAYLGFADLTHHLRANTDIATGRICRDGYTQTGWNTQPDGSGTAVGLGSRVTKEEGLLRLYAQWVPWTQADAFTYEPDVITPDPDDIVLTGYTGPKQSAQLVIPARIDGMTVVGLAEGFGAELDLETLVLPNTMVYVDRGAFTNTTIEEIYFFDNIESIYDKSFSSGIQTVHINAVLEPRYAGNSDHAQFAEDMDRLILNADKKKMVFFAGCSMSYGLRSDLVEAAFDGEYVVCNMGVIGGTNASFQFDCIARYLGEGDVFIHAPEPMSEYQLMDNIRSEVRVFYCVEGNYDLLALADLSGTELLFNNFTEFNKGRFQAEQTYTYQDYNANYNAYGDYAVPRENSPEGTSFEIAACFLPDCVNTVSTGRLNEKYAAIEARGASALVSFAPINADAIPEEEQQTRSWLEFERRLRAGIREEFPVISQVEDYLFPGRLFYDEDYHLSDEGAALRTQRLITDIQAALDREAAD